MSNALRRRIEHRLMFIWIVVLAWLYVALMMALAEAMHPNGGIVGGVFTFLLYGVLPLSLVTYLMGTPLRRKRLRAQEAAQAAGSATAPLSGGAAIEPDAGRHAPGDAVASEREEP